MITETDKLEIIVKPNSKPQTEFFKSTEYEVLYGGSAGSGKAVSIETLVPTEHGLVKMGDLKIGDKVFTNHGLLTTIVWKSDINYQAKCYELEFDNGEKIIADANHLWRTMTDKDRTRATRLTDEFRQKRKLTRESRAKKNPVHAWSQKSITQSNQSRIYEYLPMPSGQIRTTQEIFDTADAGKHARSNHSIEKAKPLNLTEQHLEIEPYLLGLWLGDGWKGSGNIGMLEEDFNNVKPYILRRTTNERLLTEKNRKPFLVCLFENLTMDIRLMGLKNNKRIPSKYLRASFRQRLDLLQGIMDTDGTVDKRGACEIMMMSKLLMEDVYDLLMSLGIKGTLRPKKVTLKGRRLADAYRVTFMAEVPVFKMPRKLNKQKLTGFRDTTKRHYIVNIKSVESIPVQCIQIAHPEGMYLIGKSYIPTHNSFALVVEPLRYIQYPRFTGIIFRRTYPELEGSIIPLAMHYYLAAGATWHEQKKTFTFPSGAKIRLGFMQHAEDWRNYQGHQYTYQGYDELTNFAWEQYEMLAAWNRSPVEGIPAYRRATSNPGGVSHSVVKKYFYDTCLPLPDGPMLYSDVARIWWQPMKSNKTYYTRNEAGRSLGRKFIPARVFDNVDLLKNNPQYVSQLLTLPEKKRKALLEGNWEVYEGQFFNEFNRDVHVVDKRYYLDYDQLLNFNTVGGLDYGNTTSVECVARDYNNNIIVFDELHSERESRSVKVTNLKKFLIDRHLQKLRIAGDTNMWIPEAFDVAASNTPAMDYINAGINLFQVSKKSLDNRSYRIGCNDAVKDLLHYEMVETNEEAFKVKPRIVIYERCKHLIETLPLLITDPNDPEDIADKQEDHDFDAFKMALMYLYIPRKQEHSYQFEWLKKLNGGKKNILKRGWQSR